MSEQVPVTAKGQKCRNHQSIRFNILGGGPSGMEVVVNCSRAGTTVMVWNPMKHPPEPGKSAWAKVYDDTEAE